jgi:hypothetical protein
MTDATHRGRTLNRRSLVLGGVSSAAAAAAFVPRGKAATYEPKDDAWIAATTLTARPRVLGG